MENKNFCILPWLHLQMKPNGQVKPCCRFNHKHEEYLEIENEIKSFNINTNNFHDIFYSDFWKKLRKDMMENKSIPGCEKCDSKSEYSMRSNANREWNNHFDYFPIADNINPEFKFLELTTGRYCNLKCRTCSSDLSTTWEEDDKLIQNLYTDPLNKGYRKSFEHNPIINLHNKNIDYSKIKLIKLTGGESMITPSFIPFVNDIIDSGNAQHIFLEIYTNSSWIPSKKILDKLKKFMFVKIILSIDGIKKVNDYIRYPSVWKTVETSVDKWIKFSQTNENFCIIMSPTINIYNILQFKDIFFWWHNKQEYFFPGKNYLFTKTNVEKNLPPYCVINVGRFHFTPLTTPKYLNCNILPEYYKQICIDNINEVSNFIKKQVKTNDDLIQYQLKKKVFDRIIQVLKQKPSDNLQNFVNFTVDLDKIRTQDIRVSIPDLWNIIKKDVVYEGLL